MFRRLTPWWVVAWLPLLLIPVGVLFPSPAHADPVDAYTVLEAPTICGWLDEHPTLAGVSTLNGAIVTDAGFTFEAAGRVVEGAVLVFCPQHVVLLNRFAAVFATKGMLV